MTVLSPTQLPPLPSLFLKRSRHDDSDWTSINTSSTIFKEDYHMVLNHDYYHKMSTTTTTDILLPPILTTQSTTNVASPVPPSPPYSTCSSALSVSSFPSSPNSSSVNSFSPPSSSFNKKGSIQSLLNSGSELLALEKRERVNSHHFFPQPQQQKKRGWKESTTTTTNKKQKVEEDNRQIKGLRLFSKQVCDKVAEKKTTTYNEVADELAADIQRNNSHSVGIDQKNIRRRVYDALNVLMALDIITKDRKEIKWLGIHHNEQDILQQEIKNEESRQKLLIDSIQKHKFSYQDARNNLNRLKQLVTRNQHHHHQHQQIIHLPFFMMQGKADIDTHYNHGNEACLSTSSSFAIYQDIDILTKIWPPSPVTTVS